nr:MAG TPA: hypothetical protein [Caudoviricetes sp.]
MVILAILIIVYIMIGYGLFLNTLSEEYIKSVWTPIIWFLWIIVLWLPYGVYSYLKERRTKDDLMRKSNSTFRRTSC